MMMMTRIHEPTDEEPIVRGSGQKEGDERYVYMRVEDRSLWFRSSYLYEKYKILTIPIFALLVLGARQWIHEAMQDTTAALSARIDTTQSAIRTEVLSRDSTNQKLTILLRVTCVSSRATKSELALAGLNCASFQAVSP